MDSSKDILPTIIKEMEIRIEFLERELFKQNNNEEKLKKRIK